MSIPKRKKSRKKARGWLTNLNIVHALRARYPCLGVFSGLWGAQDKPPALALFRAPILRLWGILPGPFVSGQVPSGNSNLTYGPIRSPGEFGLTHSLTLFRELRMHLAAPVLRIGCQAERLRDTEGLTRPVYVVHLASDHVNFSISLRITSRRLKARPALSFGSGVDACEPS